MRFFRFLFLIAFWAWGFLNPGPKLPPQILIDHPNPLLIQKDFIWYYRGKLFSGYMVERERNGKIVYQLPILNGREEGIAWAWYSTGEKLLKRIYIQGKKSGVFEQWWPNGHYRYVFHYREDKMDGAESVFYPNGHLRQLSHFKEGKEEGLQSAWNTHGDLISNYTIRKGRLYGIIGVKSCIPTGH